MEVMYLRNVGNNFWSSSRLVFVAYKTTLQRSMTV